MKLRAYGVLIAVVLATMLLSNYLQPYWVRAFVDGSESTWGWSSPGWLAVTWGWDVLVALVATLGLALLLPRGFSAWWCVGFGVVYAVVRFLVEGSFAVSNTEVGFSLWRYGSYLMSVVGAVVGGGVAIAVSAWRRRLRSVGGGREAR